MFKAPRPQIEAKVYARDRAKLSEQPPVSSGNFCLCQLHAAVIAESTRLKQVLVSGRRSTTWTAQEQLQAMKMRTTEVTMLRQHTLPPIIAFCVPSPHTN